MNQPTNIESITGIAGNQVVCRSRRSQTYNRDFISPSDHAISFTTKTGKNLGRKLLVKKAAEYTEVVLL